MDDVVPQLEEAFAKLKKELKLKTTLDQLDEIFFIRDFVRRERFVSNSLSRQLCGRIVDTYNAWLGYLHGLVMPNTGNIINMTEHQTLDDAEKTKLMTLMTELMVFNNTNVLIGLTKDKKQEAEFIDSAVTLWKETFLPTTVPILKELNAMWTRRANKNKE